MWIHIDSRWSISVLSCNKPAQWSKTSAWSEYWGSLHESADPDQCEFPESQINQDSRKIVYIVHV